MLMLRRAVMCFVLVLGAWFPPAENGLLSKEKIPSTKLKVQSSRRSPVVHGANGSIVDAATGLLPNESDLRSEERRVGKDRTSRARAAWQQQSAQKTDESRTC